MTKWTFLFKVVTMVIISKDPVYRNIQLLNLNISTKRAYGGYSLLLLFLASSHTIFLVLSRRLALFVSLFVCLILCDFWWSPDWEEMLRMRAHACVCVCRGLRPGYFHIIICLGATFRRVWKDFFLGFELYLYKIHTQIKSTTIKSPHMKTKYYKIGTVFR